MASKIKIQYHHRLFLLLLCLSWIMVACFLTFQYNRERQYKVEKLDSQLQLFNNYLIEALNKGNSLDSTLHAISTPIPDLRISLINNDGIVVYDNTLDSLPNENHLNRNEVKQAVSSGHGYTIRRHSNSSDNYYFYSATSKNGIIIRSALPYNISLQEMLRTDRTFLWFMLAITLGISIAGYFATRRIGRTISRLNTFAEKAEKGERIYNVGAFSRDELGSISGHIVRLYARLQQTVSERDLEHRKMLHEEQEKIRIKKQLTNNINHELKTPVASIIVCLETLLAHPELSDEKRDHFIKRSHDSALRLQQLLNDVSVITRMDDGSRQITKTPIDISSLVNDIAEDMSEKLANAGMQLDISIPERTNVTANPMLINSIFRNLLDNAVAYSGGSQISINLENENEKAFTFSVSDNGKGIPAEHLDRIFERFYRIDNGRSRQAGGTGLGLAIVKNAVLLHGGTISVKNRAEGGLRFIFSIAKI